MSCPTLGHRCLLMSYQAFLDFDYHQTHLLRCPFTLWNLDGIKWWCQIWTIVIIVSKLGTGTGSITLKGKGCQLHNTVETIGGLFMMMRPTMNMIWHLHVFFLLGPTKPFPVSHNFYLFFDCNFRRNELSIASLLN